MNFDDIVSFFLYVIPGFVATELYRARYPAKRDSDFIRLAWSITYSIILYALAKGLDMLFGLDLFPAGLTFPRMRTIGLLFILALLLGYLRIGYHSFRFKLAQRNPGLRLRLGLKFLYVDPLSIWAKINNEIPVEWAHVILTDGAEYLGYIYDWTYDPNEIDHDFLLKDARRVDNNMNTIYEIQGKGIYLRLSSVSRIEFYRGNLDSTSAQILCASEERMEEEGD